MPTVATLDDLAAWLGRTDAVEELFASDPAAEYRRLVKLCHPDRFPPGPQQERAQRVFAKLTACFHQATSNAPPSVVVAPQRSYAIVRQIAAGDLADVYLGVADGIQYVLKACRLNGGNALLAAEHRCLQKLAQRSGASSYRPYIPHPMESFIATGDLAGRQVNVFAHQPGLYTLETIRARHADGLDPRHLAWLFKRMLVAAGFAQRCGMVHGGFLPPHVLVHAENHGLQLVDWTQSVKTGRRLAFISTCFRDWYPPEVLNKEPATPATDIFLAARCLLYAAGGDPLSGRWPAAVPLVMRQFVDTCLYPSSEMRPQDAWRLHEEFDELLLRLFGPPKFHTLAMA